VSHERHSVALVITAPMWRGSATSFAKIARGLVDAGHRVQLFTAAESVTRGFRELGLDALTLDLPNSGFASVLRLRAVLHARVVIADAPRDVRLAALATMGRNTRLLWRFNLPNRPVPSDVVARALFRGLEGIICQSAWSAELLRERAPWLARIPVTRIANGYDLAVLRPSPGRGAAFRATHGIPADTPFVVTVGALSPEKGLPQAIAATTRLGARHPGVLHLLIGSGQDEATLRQTAPAHVRFAGALDATATADAMRAADVILLPSAREIFPNVVAEAMAVGGAVVTVHGGAAPEVAGDAAHIVEPWDVDAMADAVSQLLSEPAKRAELGARARARIAAEFALERMVEEYVELVRGEG
jgi:glycosyltransferase involved in cell wall biosynthesis